MCSRVLYNARRCRSKSGATTVHCLTAFDRAVPYTVPMKAVLQQCCTLGRVRPAPLVYRPRMDMDRSGRLFLCARCRDQVLLCSHCDRGQQYCSRVCSNLSRQERRRETAQRYQRSRPGRLKHAARTARWRARRRSLRQASAGCKIDKVTHQGCLVEAADASLIPCDIPSTCVPVDTDSTPLAGLVCSHCRQPLLPHVRLGYLRPNSIRWRGGHDHPR